MIDGELKFIHNSFEDINAFAEKDMYSLYAMDEYLLPSVLRKILKTTKRKEIVEVTTTRKDKLIPHFEDESGVFNKQMFEDMKDKATITFALVDFEEKDHLFKINMEEKL